MKDDDSTVLIAEDNQINAHVMRTIIEREGLRASVVPDGKAALKACQEKHFQIVFMDLQMPEMDGFEATRQIKNDPACGEPLVIVVSASVQPSDRTASFAAGADGFIAKPVNLKEVRKVLAQLESSSQ